MSPDTPKNEQEQQRIGRWVSGVIVAAAVLLGLIVLYHSIHHPQTDDATVFANYIGIAPQVEGPLIHLNVQDNQFVTNGTLLFEIDDRPYQYALENALSEQAVLEGQITNEQRRIAALTSAVSVSEANIRSAEADVVTAGQGVKRAQVEWAYASNNLQRLEPLLVKHFVTVDDIDKTRTSEVALLEAFRQAQSKLLLTQATLKSTQAQHEQAANAVTTLEPLINQRGAREAAVRNARYNLNNCRVYSPFGGARGPTSKISEGAHDATWVRRCSF